MKILIYGSSHLAEITVDLLKNHYDLVGYIPSESPTIAGNINLPIVDESVEHDIKLSLQYDRKIINIENAYNVHTGLLPYWGGTDILYHSLYTERITEQGLTFHRMGESFDYGNIISKITYPVFPETDTMVSLYSRMIQIAPHFVLNSLQLLETMNPHDIDKCDKIYPRLFKRGNIQETHLDIYKETLVKLRNKYE
jgi:methionyl-tRNA formyltransferase